jgi:folate-binding protein YgfZ
MRGDIAGMKAAFLPDRGALKVAGDDARKFLQGLLTADMTDLQAGEARFAALLTPQGKIIADFIVVEAPPADGGGLFLDLPRNLAKPLVDKLNLYKLRARLVVEDLSDTLGIVAVWGGPRPGAALPGLAYRDPRLAALGWRTMIARHLAPEVALTLGDVPADADDYELHRIALGIPRGGADFSYGDAFPHETDMDQLGGVDFTKGCYVGQEVVSRMEHRGSARTRAMSVRYDGETPSPGTTITAADRQVGTMGSAAGGHGLALLRLDRVSEALSRGEELRAGRVTIKPIKPDWARFAFPDGSKAAE